MTYRIKKNKKTRLYEVFELRDKFGRRVIHSCTSRSLADQFIKLLYLGMREDVFK